MFKYFENEHVRFYIHHRQQAVNVQGKAIKSENLAKEIEEMQDKADFYKEGLSELKSDIASRIKRFYLLAKIFLSLRKRLTP